MHSVLFSFPFHCIDDVQMPIIFFSRVTPSFRLFFSSFLSFYFTCFNLNYNFVIPAISLAATKQKVRTNDRPIELHHAKNRVHILGTSVCEPKKKKELLLLLLLNIYKFA